MVLERSALSFVYKCNSSGLSIKALMIFIGLHMCHVRMTVENVACDCVRIALLRVVE